MAWQPLVPPWHVDQSHPQRIQRIERIMSGLYGTPAYTEFTMSGLWDRNAWHDSVCMVCMLGVPAYSSQCMRSMRCMRGGFIFPLAEGAIINAWGRACGTVSEQWKISHCLIIHIHAFVCGICLTPDFVKLALQWSLHITVDAHNCWQTLELNMSCSRLNSHGKKRSMPDWPRTCHVLWYARQESQSDAAAHISWEKHDNESMFVIRLCTACIWNIYVYICIYMYIYIYINITFMPKQSLCEAMLLSILCSCKLSDFLLHTIAHVLKTCLFLLTEPRRGTGTQWHIDETVLGEIYSLYVSFARFDYRNMHTPREFAVIVWWDGAFFPLVWKKTAISAYDLSVHGWRTAQGSVSVATTWDIRVQNEAGLWQTR
jgi:hypothetical protein